METGRGFAHEGGGGERKGLKAFFSWKLRMGVWGSSIRRRNRMPVALGFFQMEEYALLEIERRGNSQWGIVSSKRTTTIMMAFVIIMRFISCPWAWAWARARALDASSGGRSP
jgi:hypothetical protein